MQVNRLLLSAFRQPWLIEYSTAEALLPVLNQIMLGQPVVMEKPEAPVVAGAISMTTGKSVHYKSFDEAPEGSVAIIHLKGVMMRDDDCWGDPGTETLARWTQQAYDHPNIAAVVKVINSGGGAVDGTEVYAQTAANPAKPMVVLVQGMMASAAAWVGMKANYVMLEGKTSMVGSIGTQISIPDRTKYLENLGITEHLIRADESEDKNETYEQAKAGNYKPIKVELLNPLNSVFLQEVRAARAGKLDPDKKLTGKMFVGDAAISEGLADGYGTLTDAIQMALSLASNQQGNSDSNPNSLHNSNSETMSLFGKKFPKVAALAGKKAADLTAEVMQEANAELEAAGIEGAALITEAEHAAYETAATSAAELAIANASLTTSNGTLTAENTRLTTELAEAQAEVQRLGAMDGAKPSGSGKATVELSEEEKSTASIIAGLEHNKAIADNPLFN